MKKGDKVLVYGNAERPKDDPMYALFPLAYLNGREATVVFVSDYAEEIYVRFKADKSKSYSRPFGSTVHRKQCEVIKNENRRRVVRAKKSARKSN